jgi:hypothetical protein
MACSGTALLFFFTFTDISKFVYRDKFSVLPAMMTPFLFTQRAFFRKNASNAKNMKKGKTIILFLRFLTRVMEMYPEYGNFT